MACGNTRHCSLWLHANTAKGDVGHRRVAAVVAAATEAAAATTKATAKEKQR